MGIYKLSYQNLRRNKWRNISTILRIALGVIILILLLSSGIGLNSFLKEGQTLPGYIFSNPSDNSTTKFNLTDNQIVNSITVLINSTLGIDITSSEGLMQLENLISNLIYFLDFMASIIFLVGIFGITYAMDINLLERKREVALLKLMGFTSIQIGLTHLLEAFLLGFIGAVIGSVVGIFGIVLAANIINIIPLSLLLPWWLPVVVILVTAFLSAVLVAFSVWQSTKTDPIEVLRHG
ncbi:ABC transporter permease [Methanobacterium alcaliphilum]|uniref:ABC transporter permease n=1 Tax=Methanobacterium alcaliphilum TaxID=392018 RepID=UPI00200A0DE1|nr:FtsX-like permease family protein [Methanobacterium alcaliphilum]MCK9152550.1 FtsX-like permease family protein [Methanobacterium alcaliphilum]